MNDEYPFLVSTLQLSYIPRTSIFIVQPCGIRKKKMRNRIHSSMFYILKSFSLEEYGFFNLKYHLHSFKLLNL